MIVSRLDPNITSKYNHKVKFDKFNLNHNSWAAFSGFYDFIESFRDEDTRNRIHRRIIDLMHDKPMTKESIDTVIEYIRECGK